METINILIAGVGGQGTLLASRVLGNYALLKDLDCKLSEVHGMSQRGGSVVTHVKMGKKIYSPVISSGEADIIIAFEALEAARYSGCLKNGGMIIANEQNIMPMPVVTGEAKYPYGILDELKEKGLNVVKVNALKIAESIGNIKAVNIIILGKAAKVLGLDKEVMLCAIKESVPQKSLDINVKAFEIGYNS